MPIDWNSLIKDAEGALTKALVARAVTGIVAAFPLLAGVSGPLGFLLGLVVGQLVKYGDWVSFHLGDDWMNSAHGQVFQKAGEALDNLPKTATKEEIDAAKKSKADAFDALMGAE